MIDFDLLVDIGICVVWGLMVGAMIVAMARALERAKRADVEEFHSMMHCSEEVPRRLK